MGGDQSRGSRSEWRSFKIAVRDGDLCKLKQIIKSHPQFINAIDGDNWTPLHEVSYMCNIPEFALQLIRAGAKVNNQDKWHRTPLHLATFKNNDQVRCFSMIIWY